MGPRSTEYRLLKEHGVRLNDTNINDDQPLPPTRFSRFTNFTIVGIFVLILVTTNLWTAIVALRLLPGYSSRVDICSTHNTLCKASEESQEAITYPVLDELPTQFTRFKWWTPWGLEAGANNDTNLPSAYVVDELWEGVLPSHGIVAVDREWAKERHWPESMYLPKDPHGKEKAVYLLEAYHLIHCLTIMRLSFVEARRGLPLTWPVGHTTHCFDIMRQSIQCNADNTPLYTFGDMTAGDGQLRKCKDWDALRSWATEHSACYRDSVESIPLQDHFGFCEDGRPYQDGKDGLP